MDLREVAKELDKFHKGHPTEVLELGVLVDGDVYYIQSLMYEDGMVYLELKDR